MIRSHKAMASRKRTKKYVDFNDTSIPIGKRKVAYVKWLMQKKGYSRSGAKLACYKKFYHEEHS